MADKIASSHEKGSAAQCYAWLSIIPKVALALAGGVSFIVLEYVGFTAGAANTSAALSALIILYAAVPCVLKLVAALIIWKASNTKGENYEHLKRSDRNGFIGLS